MTIIAALLCAISSPHKPLQTLNASRSIPVFLPLIGSRTPRANGLTLVPAVVFRPYAFNYRGELSYYCTTKHGLVNAEFQTCTPNYAGEPNGANDDQPYGRVYIPSGKTCLAVANPTGNPPYYVTSKPYLNSANGEMKTDKSIPFNFVADASGGDVDFRWLGGTIPSKKIYQGPDPPAQYCFGQYFVNSTNLQHGFNFNGLGEPNTSGSTAEAYRIHLYCNEKQGGEGSTGFNNFALVPANQVSN